MCVSTTVITRSKETGHGNNSGRYSFVCTQQYRYESRGGRLRVCINYRSCVNTWYIASIICCSKANNKKAPI